MRIPVIVALVLLLVAGTAAAASSDVIRVGSKRFSESYLLGELLAQLLERDGYAVERRFGLGGTLICYEALRNDEIDVYPEYTGTLSTGILELATAPDFPALRTIAAERELALLAPFGFNNTYALVMREAQAEALAIRTLTDLAGHGSLKLAFSHEFLEREDGWPGLAALYGYPGVPRGLDHGLAYQALEEGAVDVTDAYSTDGELKRYPVRVLADDRGFFPAYLAVPLARADLPEPVKVTLARAAGSLSDDAMRALNGRVVLGGDSFATVAAAHLATLATVKPGAAAATTAPSGLWQDLLRNTLVHLQLTVTALVLAVAVALSVAVLVFRQRRLANAILYGCGLLQTIPSIALLALMIPLFGIGVVPAIVALFLYSLLPILRNAITGLTGLDPTLERVAVAMGLSYGEQLRHVYFPLALPAILAGIRTAAVISIGTATLAAFIGAGGLGDPIVTGLSLNNVGLILQGALPAAGLAVLTELLFEALELVLLPRHLRAR